MMDGFERRRQDKKRAILAAAHELFNKYEFDKVNVSEIAKQAHVSKVSIYNFFKSKENLRREIMKGVMDKGLGELKELVSTKKPYIEKIPEYIKLGINFNINFNIEFFFDAVESDAALREYFDGYLKKHTELLFAFIEEGKAEGYFDASISNKAIILYIDMFQSYFLNNKSIRKDLENAPELAKEVHLLFFDGLIRN